MRNFDFMNEEPVYNTELYMVSEADITKEFDHTSIYRSDAFNEAMKSSFELFFPIFNVLRL